jgi:hypothetical protein
MDVKTFKQEIEVELDKISSLPEMRDRVITFEDIIKIALNLHRKPSDMRKSTRKDQLFLLYWIERDEAEGKIKPVVFPPRAEIENLQFNDDDLLKISLFLREAPSQFLDEPKEDLLYLFHGIKQMEVM